MDKIQNEKEALGSRLQDALSSVAETNDSARGFIVNLPDILFDVNEATLKPAAQVVIAKLVGILLVMPDLNLRIEGHTDATGSSEYNLKLSKQRAESVRAFLDESGIEQSRMDSIGYGKERPMASNDTTEGRSKNRRVEIVIAAGNIQAAEPVK